MNSRIELYPRTPLSIRLFDRMPFNAFWSGVLVGALIFALYVLYSMLFGPGLGGFAVEPNLQTPWIFAAELIQDLFIGFTIALSVASIRASRSDVRDLVPHLDVEQQDRTDLDRSLKTYRPGWLLVAGLCGGVGSGLMIGIDAGVFRDGWTPAALWFVGRNFANWWFVFRAMFLEINLGLAFSHLGDRLGEVDLLERGPLAPFARRALRNVLLWMLLAAFLSLTYLGEGWASDLLALALLALTVFAFAAFSVPLLGAHRRIRALKHVELSRIRVAIREARELVLEPELAGRATGGRLADLLRYEERIAQVADWPIDTSTLLRFMLYLTIGLGSWVGAAVVERALDVALP